MDRREIAELIGTSLSNLTRAFRGKRMAYHNYCVANPNLIKSVNHYYGKHGRIKTAKRFGLKPKQIEHIVYKYKMYKPRQIRWTNKEIIELARMAGLVSPEAQYKYFCRPGAKSGSIISAWAKKFRAAATQINGMNHFTAKHLVTQNARYLKPLGSNRSNKKITFRRVILWIDMEKNLKSDVPKFIKNAIKTLAEFQRWLHGRHQTRRRILDMIKQREYKTLD